MDGIAVENPYDGTRNGAASPHGRTRAGTDIRERSGKAEMNRVKTAILWGPDDLLAEAMEIIFKNEEGWHVIRIPFCSGLSSLVQEVHSVGPELVIICHSSVRDDSDALLKLIQEQPELKVIAVSLTNNLMHVYSKHTVTIRSVSDLLSVIDDGSFSLHSIHKEVQ
jgi:hypothetical protein